MPTSLRLPADIETRISGFGSRTGLTKSAVIVRSIEEFLARHAEPSSLHIYEEAMRSAASQSENQRATPARNPSKQQVLQSIRSKHAQRSARATSALASQRKA
jgi:predicted DNA-binding protein